MAQENDLQIFDFSDFKSFAFAPSSYARIYLRLPDKTDLGFIGDKVTHLKSA